MLAIAIAEVETGTEVAPAEDPEGACGVTTDNRVVVAPEAALEPKLSPGDVPAGKVAVILGVGAPPGTDPGAETEEIETIGTTLTLVLVLIAGVCELGVSPVAVDTGPDPA